MSSRRNNSAQALARVKVLEMGQLIAGPFCGKILGEFGAEVIKIEPPGQGDPLRKWRLIRGGASVWWQVQSRNKRSVTLNLRQPEGQEIARALAAEADVLIENFRPGTLENWGLGWEVLSALNPGLVMLRVSGYGQDGPYRDRPGFAAIAEAVGGLRFLTGEAGRIPVRSGVSLGDTLAALHGAIGVLLALYHRSANGGRGQIVDVALYESVFNCMESLLPEFSAFGAVRQPAGSTLPGIAPSNAYPCVDGLVLISGNGDSIFRRLMRAIGRADLADNVRLASNEGRVTYVDEIDAAIVQWTQQRTVQQALDCLIAVQVPCGRVYTVKDIAQDPQYHARGMIQRINTCDGDALDVPGIVPKLSATPGSIREPAPTLGADTASVLGALGFSEERLADLRRRHII